MLLVILLLQIPAPAETRAGRWVRRGATSLLCATSAIDAIQTVSLAGRPGIYESNSLFRRNQGVNVPMVVGMKALVCATSVVLGERLPPARRGMLTGLNLAGTGVNTFVILHNRQVAKTAAQARP